MADKSKEYLIVAAIDFGTAYSGYAFSTRSDFLKDPLKIVTNTWQGDTLLSHKTVTCVLFDEDKKFKAFGFDAENQYADLAIDKKHTKYFFFTRFKMRLFNQTQLQRNFLLEDEMGKKMPAIDVFSACIRYLREHLMEHSRKQVSHIADTDFRWVLTVPAIWNDTSKQFMREAAEKAGFESDQLLIALEPEAASLCCRHLPMTTIKGCSGGFVPFAPKSKYLVLDAGGGTIDITIHQVQDNGSIKELYAANGGDWGGTYIDKAFRDLLSDIVESTLMDDFQHAKMDDYIGLFREFEVKKRKFKKDMAEKITFKVPIALDETFEHKNKKSIKDHIATKPQYNGNIIWTVDKLRIGADIARNLYTKALDKISHHLKSLFTVDLVKDVSTILLVGGFSESEMLQCMIREQFPDKKLIIPAEPGLAVLKGAVIFGHDPQVIKERRCRHTYGVGTTVIFDDSIHPVSKKFTANGTDRCKDIFSKHVEIGQPVLVEENQIELTYTPVYDDQTKMTFGVYISPERDPMYVDGPSCKRLGSLEIDIEGTGLNRSVTVQMTFSDTELHVAGTNNNTGKKTLAKFDFLG
ncbi:Heat shock 70 kDa protein 12A [Mactra antiquata]